LFRAIFWSRVVFWFYFSFFHFFIFIFQVKILFLCNFFFSINLAEEFFEIKTRKQKWVV
jgi:hypothetical protein